MLVTLNTGLVDGMTIDTYHMYSPDNIHVDEEDLEELEVDNENDAWEHFSFDRYCELIIDNFKEAYLNENILVQGEDIGMKIVSVGKIESPREYNFATDTLEFTIDIDIDKCIEMVKRFDFDGFNDFLADNFTTRSGFMSFTANDYDDWVEAFRKGRVQEVGAFLSHFADLDDMVEAFSQSMHCIYFMQCVE